MSSKTPNKRIKQFKFKKNSNIGVAEATQDKKFLEHCFIDNGELSILYDNNDSKCIVIGRTGSGKTALLEKLSQDQERFIKINPENLALTFLSDNTSLKFFTDLGVNLDLFYRLLWKHIFVVEIIKSNYNIINEQTRDNFLQKIGERIFKNKSKKDAISYLIKWGESFWQETDYRVKEITVKLEEELKTAIGGELKVSLPFAGNITGNAGQESLKSLSEEQKVSIVQLAQPIVHKVQIKTLSDIVKVLEEDILNDRKKKFYITIDRLDEGWVIGTLRFQLIRALLETIREFNEALSNVKIVIALREDLIDRVFRYTRSSGQQQEKYQSMYLNLSWKRKELENLLDQRVSQLIREQYTKEEVTVRDLLPSKVNEGNQKIDPVDYLLDRTMLRPRDAIDFFNECIKAAEGKATITQANIFDAEMQYSENRLRALAEEWFADYETLIDVVYVFKKYPNKFKLSDVNRNQFNDFMLDFLVKKSDKKDTLYNMVSEKLFNEKSEELLQELCKIFHKIGFLGIKLESYSSINWSYNGHRINTFEITNEATLEIHKAFWRTLGIKP